MSDDLNPELLAHLLEDAGPAERAAVERRLKRDRAAAARLKDCADLLALYAMAEASESALGAREHRELLEGVLAGAARGGDSGSGAWWRRHLWPMAAAALLLLNVGQAALYFGHVWGGATRTAGRESLNGGNAPGDPARPGAAAAGVAGTAPVPGAGRVQNPGVGKPAPSSALATSASSSEGEAAEETAREQEVRQEYLRLLEDREALNPDFGRILQQLTVQNVVEAGTAHIVAMELSKPEAGTGAGTGLQTSATGTTPATSSAAASVGTGAALTSATSVSAATTLADTAGTGQEAAGTANGSAGSSSSGADASSGAPYAVSLYDPVLNQGYMELYNLPQVTADQSLQLWVQPAGSTTYENVGTVPPQVDGQPGGIYYKLPSGVTTVTQIIVTLEPSAAAPTAPTGPVVLRGT